MQFQNTTSNRILKVLGSVICAGLVCFLAGSTAIARDQIRIVGSSTVYPFASYVAEEFGATTKYPTPVIESTGSGGGIKLFSEGVGMNTPDITNASRRMKVKEFQRCHKNDVTEITEAVIGYDGIAIAHNVRNKAMDLTLKQLTLAVAAEVPRDGKLVKNPYTFWDQIDKNLPHRRIVIYGPPTSSGTRDAFEELVMEVASEEIEGYGGEYTKIRQDGAFIPAGENDNLIVQRLDRNKAAFGIFGYSFLAENPDKIQGASIHGVKPEPESISSGKYPIARSLFFYIKNAHVDKVPGMAEYIELFMSEKMIGPDGYLKDLGLIPLPEALRKKSRERVMNRANLHLKLSDLHSYK